MTRKTSLSTTTASSRSYVPVSVTSLVYHTKFFLASPTHLMNCALVLEHSERHQFQAHMWKRVNCPLNYDVNNCVYSISVNFDQIHATQPSIVYLVLVFDACLRLDQILDIRLKQTIVDSEISLNSIVIN